MLSKWTSTGLDLVGCCKLGLNHSRHFSTRSLCTNDKDSGAVSPYPSPSWVESQAPAEVTFFSQCLSSRLPPLRWARSLCLLPAASISGPSSVHALLFRPQLCNHKQITYPCCNCRSSGLWGFKIMVLDEVRCVCVCLFPLPHCKVREDQWKNHEGVFSIHLPKW